MSASERGGDHMTPDSRPTDPGTALAATTQQATTQQATTDRTTARSRVADARSTRARFRQWRRSRPFWAGVCTTLSGLVILFPPYASLKFGDVVVSLNTLTGMSALVIGVVLLSSAVSFWIRPQFRFPAGIVTLLVSVAAIVTANLGSLLIGTVLGIVGAALGIAWSPSAKKRRARKAPPIGEHAMGGGA